MSSPTSSLVGSNSTSRGGGGGSNYNRLFHELQLCPSLIAANIPVVLLPLIASYASCQRIVLLGSGSGLHDTASSLVLGMVTHGMASAIHYHYTVHNLL
jgi:hypothetical protein